MKQINIEDVKNYKKTSKKSYEVYACIPKKGTLIINKLEQAELYNRTGRKDHFTAEEVEKKGLLQSYANEIKSGKMHLADGNLVCICGTVGELYLTSMQNVFGTYTFADGNLINNPDSLKKEWRVLKTKRDNMTLFACFVHKTQKGMIRTAHGTMEYNGVLADHGKGDFIVCNCMPDGRPNIADKRVVNGNVFATTYKNTGFQDCISATDKFDRINISTLPKICGLPSEETAKPLSIAVFAQKCDTLMKNLQQICKFEIVTKSCTETEKYKEHGLRVPKAYVAQYNIKGHFNDEEVGQFPNSCISFVCNKVDVESALNMIIENGGTTDYLVKGFPLGTSKADRQKGYYVSHANAIQGMNCAEEAKAFMQKLPSKYSDWIVNKKENFIDGEAEEYIEASINSINAVVNTLSDGAYNLEDIDGTYLSSFRSAISLPNCFLANDLYKAGLNTKYVEAVKTINVIKVFLLALQDSVQKAQIRNALATVGAMFAYNPTKGEFSISSETFYSMHLEIFPQGNRVCVKVNGTDSFIPDNIVNNLYSVIEAHKKAAASQTTSDTVYSELRKEKLYSFFKLSLETLCKVLLNDDEVSYYLPYISKSLHNWVTQQGFNIIRDFEYDDTSLTDRIQIDGDDDYTITLFVKLDPDKKNDTVNFRMRAQTNGKKLGLIKEVFNMKKGNFMLFRVKDEDFNGLYSDIWSKAIYKDLELTPTNA